MEAEWSVICQLNTAGNQKKKKETRVFPGGREYVISKRNFRAHVTEDIPEYAVRGPLGSFYRTILNLI